MVEACRWRLLWLISKKKGSQRIGTQGVWWGEQDVEPIICNRTNSLKINVLRTKVAKN